MFIQLYKTLNDHSFCGGKCWTDTMLVITGAPHKKGLDGRQVNDRFEEHKGWVKHKRQALSL